METRSYSINTNISWKLLKDKVVAVNMDNGSYYTFNFTSSLIWQYIDRKKTITEVEQLMAEQFADVEGQVLKDDIDEIIEYWISEKLISKI
jgi:UDP-galactopyranose mutase